MNIKKQARRDRAAKRFTVLTNAEWQTSNISTSSDGKFYRFDRRVKSGPKGYRAGYADYLVAKRIEAASLGI